MLNLAVTSGLIDRLPLPALLDVGIGIPSTVLRQELPDTKVSNQAIDHLTQDRFISIPFRSDRPFNLAKFEHFLMTQMPVEVFRAKGILWFEGEEQRHIFQLSGKRCSINPEPWSTSSQNQLIFIGRQLNPLQLHQHLTNCLAGSRVSLLS